MIAFWAELNRLAPMLRLWNIRSHAGFELGGSSNRGQNLTRIQ